MVLRSSEQPAAAGGDAFASRSPVASARTRVCPRRATSNEVPAWVNGDREVPTIDSAAGCDTGKP